MMKVKEVGVSIKGGGWGQGVYNEECLTGLGIG